MSKQAINQYYSKLDQYKRFGGTRNETSVRRAFANLLEEYCQSKNLLLVDEVHLKSSQKRPDGTVKDALQLDWGHWESKDPADNLDEEIRKKFEAGYPRFNIIFENSEEIVLIQQGSVILRRKMNDPDALHLVLTEFVNYERPEIKEFRLAVEKFKQDIPDIIEALRSMIAGQEKTNREFEKKISGFWKLCKESINPEITAFDIREMLIQHILTAEIFDTVFGDSHFHRENNIAKELEAVVNTFFTGTVRRNTLAGIDSYYKAIKAEAARIDNHHEKQNFLKVVYENFYKAYNPKGADRLGIVYTPGEIVKFMVQSTDYLLEKHFGKSLADKNVEILDPATGTGTFITDIIEYIPPQYLEHKYKNEIHANELAILPYYIASLNIEYTYQQKMGKYEPFDNIVFVDTLDNMGFEFKGKQGIFDGFGMSAENLARIKKQNDRKISVIIGNPPYNANQMNENDNNKNREYSQVDKRIKETYIKESTAQKTKLYDMYARFLRWASDRIDKNGIIAFITNRSFINSRTFDGFRKTVQQEFDYIYIVDLNGDLRAGKKEASGNVFGIKIGVSIVFMLKKNFFDLQGKTVQKEAAKISYTSVFRFGTAKEKLNYLGTTKFREIPFETIRPDKDFNWIEIAENDFLSLIQVADKPGSKNENTIFRLFTNGVVSNRDRWVYDIDKSNLIGKIKFFIQTYNRLIDEHLKHKGENEKQYWDNTLKWSRDLKLKFQRHRKITFAKRKIIRTYFRPFTEMYHFADKILNDRLSQLHYELLGDDLDLENKVIIYSFGKREVFAVLATKCLPNLDVFMPNATHCLALYRYDKDGNRHDNITDWSLRQFTEHYQDDKISKEDIFHYTYAVLHNPEYRKKYEINLKREFPRLPFYEDFYKWVKWGKSLMDLHIAYESAKPYSLKIHETAHKDMPKAKLQAVPEKGEIVLDENTGISGIPASAWEYKLGNRSALHWILDQYKEKKPKDKTIAEKFNTYRFADYKEQVIDLLKRVSAVSVKTVEIVKEMEKSGER